MRVTGTLCFVHAFLHHFNVSKFSVVLIVISLDKIMYGGKVPFVGMVMSLDIEYAPTAGFVECNEITKNSVNESRFRNSAFQFVETHWGYWTNALDIKNLT